MRGPLGGADHRRVSLLRNDVAADRHAPPGEELPAADAVGFQVLDRRALSQFLSYDANAAERRWLLS